MSKVTYDFKIVGSNISGVSQVIAQNEEAYNWLIEEAHMTVFADGSSALFEERVSEFVNDAGWSHFVCDWDLQTV